MSDKTLAPSVNTRDPKGLKFVSIVESAYNKSRLTEEEAQRVNDTPGLAELIGNFISESRCPDKHKDEEVASSYSYLSGYQKPIPIADQIARLRELFPCVDLGTANLELGNETPNSFAEGHFAVPDWKLIAPTYPEAVQKVLDLIKQTRNGKLCNYREGEIDAQHLRQSAKSETVWAAINEAQAGHGIVIVQAQFGLRHRGRSVRRALEVMGTSEFGLGAFTIGIMLLLSPIRLQHYDDLWIDCAGDEFNSGAGGAFGRAPCFSFDGGGVRFVTLEVYYADGGYGSASGFLPQ